MAGYGVELVKYLNRAVFPRTQLSSVRRGYGVRETSQGALDAAGALHGSSLSSSKGQHRHTKSSSRFQTKASVATMI